MLRTFAKRRVVAALAVIGALALAAGAYAYFTSSGTGSGQATVGKSSSFVVTQGTAPTGLLPGATASQFDITVKNSASFSQQLSKVTVAVAAGFSAQQDSSKPACTASDFTLTPPTVTATTLQAGASTTLTDASIAMNETGANQDNCQGVAVPLTITAG